MTSKSFYKEFDSLPDEGQKQVLSFIEFLQKSYRSKNKKTNIGKSVLTDNKFVGIWKNREDLKDSTLWIKDLRQKEWSRIAG